MHQLKNLPRNAVIEIESQLQQNYSPRGNVSSTESLLCFASGRCWYGMPSANRRTLEVPKWMILSSIC
jgi:hypothetical protein